MVERIAHLCFSVERIAHLGLLVERIIAHLYFSVERIPHICCDDCKSCGATHTGKSVTTLSWVEIPVLYEIPLQTFQLFSRILSFIFTEFRLHKRAVGFERDFSSSLLIIVPIFVSCSGSENDQVCFPDHKNTASGSQLITRQWIHFKYFIINCAVCLMFFQTHQCILTCKEVLSSDLDSKFENMASWLYRELGFLSNRSQNYGM